MTNTLRLSWRLAFIQLSRRHSLVAEPRCCALVIARHHKSKPLNCSWRAVYEHPVENVVEHPHCDVCESNALKNCGLQ